MNVVTASWLPANDLVPFIAGYRFLECPPGMILPAAPHASILFRLAEADSGLPSTAFVGLRQQPARVGGAACGRVLQVVVQAQAVEAVTRTRGESLRDGIVDLTDLAGPSAWRLQERLVQAEDHAARIAIFESWLRTRVAGRDSAAMHAVAAVIQRWRVDRERRVRDIASDIGAGERQLERWFLRCAGVRPKFFQRMLRWHDACKAVMAAPETDWASIASGFGYADQSHLVREFVALTGDTPTGWARHPEVFALAGALPSNPVRVDPVYAAA